VTALLALLLLHENSVSSSRAEIASRELRVTFSFTLEEMSGLARLDLDRNGRIDRAEWEATFPLLAAYVADRVQVDNNGERCRAEVEQGVPELREPITMTVRYKASAPLDRLRLRCGLFKEHDGNPRHVMDLGDGRTIVFDRDRAEADLPVTPKRLPWGPMSSAVVALGVVLRYARTRRGQPPSPPRSKGISSTLPSAFPARARPES
jgi:hypothetical protein